jgi:hypothetical protein
MAQPMSSIKSSRAHAIIQLRAFVEATRDSGYKNAGSAIAELIDNSVEANANEVNVDVLETVLKGLPEFTVIVTDDGTGMNR